MRSIERNKHIQVRLTEPEIVYFKQVANDNGLSLSGFARYIMARARIILNAVKKEM
jgi:predicted DNA binding CopG/RHH family protein